MRATVVVHVPARYYTARDARDVAGETVTVAWAGCVAAATRRSDRGRRGRTTRRTRTAARQRRCRVRVRTSPDPARKATGCETHRARAVRQALECRDDERRPGPRPPHHIRVRGWQNRRTAGSGPVEWSPQKPTAFQAFATAFLFGGANGGGHLGTHRRPSAGSRCAGSAPASSGTRYLPPSPRHCRPALSPPGRTRGWECPS